MTQPHPHLGAAYRLTQSGDAFAVEVSVPGMAPTTISGCATMASAERWIAEHREAVAAGRPVRPLFRRSGKAT